MEVKEIKKKLKKSLDKQRYQHTLGVMYTAGCLAMANAINRKGNACRPCFMTAPSVFRLTRKSDSV